MGKIGAMQTLEKTTQQTQAVATHVVQDTKAVDLNSKSAVINRSLASGNEMVVLHAKVIDAEALSHHYRYHNGTAATISSIGITLNKTQCRRNAPWLDCLPIDRLVHMTLREANWYWRIRRPAERHLQ